MDRSRQRAAPGRSVVLTAVQAWARRRFGTFSIAVFVAVVLLVLLDGVSAALHYHTAVAICGVLIVLLVAAWFRVAQCRRR